MHSINGAGDVVGGVGVVVVVRAELWINAVGVVLP